MFEAAMTLVFATVIPGATAPRFGARPGRPCHWPDPDGHPPGGDQDDRRIGRSRAVHRACGLCRRQGSDRPLGVHRCPAGRWRPGPASAASGGDIWIRAKGASPSPNTPGGRRNDPTGRNRGRGAGPPRRHAGQRRYFQQATCTAMADPSPVRSSGAIWPATGLAGVAVRPRAASRAAMAGAGVR